MSTKTTSTQVQFRYTTKVVDLIHVLADIRKCSGMTYKETKQLFDQAQSNKRRFFTVNTPDADSAETIACLLKKVHCQVK